MSTLQTDTFIPHSYLIDRRGDLDFGAAPSQPLMVATESCASWDGERRSHGYNEHSLYAAFQAGSPCFVLYTRWRALPPYSCDDRDERVITIAEGVELLMQLGLLGHLWPSGITQVAA